MLDTHYHGTKDADDIEEIPAKTSAPVPVVEVKANKTSKPSTEDESIDELLKDL